jgi:hypothetical protein
LVGPVDYIGSMKILSIASLAICGLLCSFPLHAQVLDNFSTPASTDMLNYNAVAEYVGSGTASTFAINGADQFQAANSTPSTSNSTTDFYWKSAVLSDTIFNQSVSVDIDEIYTQGAAGLGLATSTSGGNYAEYSIYNVSGNGSGTAGITGISPTGLTINFALGAITETITRTSNTGFTLQLAGLGLTSGGGTYTTTFTDSSFSGKSVYFGLDIYTGDTSGAAGHQIEDNLTYVPEPSTYALMLGSLAAFIFVVGIRRSSQRV